MSIVYCGGVGVQKDFLYSQMSIPCVECAITEIYLLLVARNLLKYILLLFFFLRHIILLVAGLVVASLSLVAFTVLDYMSNTTSVL